MINEIQRELDEITEMYVGALHRMNLFIEKHGSDYDATWDRANQAYDEDLAICYADNGGNA